MHEKAPFRHAHHFHIVTQSHITELSWRNEEITNNSQRDRTPSAALTAVLAHMTHTWLNGGILSKGVPHTPLTPALRPRQADLSESKASLGYKVSSRRAGTTHREKPSL